MATQTYLKQSGGNLTEGRTVETSAGAGDANKIPNTNASGVLDDSIINASATSSANKIVKMNGSGIIAPAVLNGTATSSGSGDAAKVVQLDSNGRIDSTMMPVGIGADTATIQASENLAAGDFVNVHNSGGSRVRKADASNGREAMGFVLSAVTSGQNATVYFEGQNTQVSSKTPGAIQYLSGSSPGASTETAPTTATHILQRVGYAASATAIVFEAETPITLA